MIIIIILTVSFENQYRPIMVRARYGRRRSHFDRAHAGPIMDENEFSDSEDTTLRPVVTRHLLSTSSKMEVRRWVSSQAVGSAAGANVFFPGVFCGRVAEASTATMYILANSNLSDALRLKRACNHNGCYSSHLPRIVLDLYDTIVRSVGARRF
jgi:hypothetical protein